MTYTIHRKKKTLPCCISPTKMFLTNLTASKSSAASAGLSALTQMEWAIRRAVEAGSIDPDSLGMNEQARETNSQIIQKIWRGEEVFDAMDEPESFRAFLRENTPRLFKLHAELGTNIIVTDYTSPRFAEMFESNGKEPS